MTNAFASSISRVSHVRDVGAVPFPAFGVENIYMLPFFQNEDLPAFARHWQATVDAMLARVCTTAPIFLMVDSAVVPAGTTHRRPGVHVDGYWQPDLQGMEDDVRGWVAHMQSQRRTRAGRHNHVRTATYEEALVLASNVAACQAYLGEWHGPAGEGGDCKDVDVSRLTARLLDAGRAWAGETGSLLHETIACEQQVERAVVRLNVPQATWR